MAEQLEVSAWLAVTFTYSEERIVPLKLDYIYGICLEFYDGLSVSVPSKDMISKHLPKLFDIEPCRVKDQGKRPIAYKHIAVRDNKSTDIVVPGYSDLSLLPDGEFQISCPIISIVNGEQQYCIARIGRKKTTLTVRHIDFQLPITFPFNQQSVDGILLLMQKIKICEGIEATTKHSKAFTEERVSLMHDENWSKTMIRSKSCKILLSLCSKLSCCGTCLDSHRNFMKKTNRKKQKIENIKSPKHDNLTNNEQPNDELKDGES
ncbi:hypothetical protein ScPMuIL_017855 [Solemya velum]